MRINWVTRECTIRAPDPHHMARMTHFRSLSRLLGTVQTIRCKTRCPRPCLYDNQGKSPLPPTGNCFGYFPNEWMTFQVHVKMGPRVNDEFTNSFVQLWIAREGQPSTLVIDWGPYNLSAGSASANQKYGKVWLLPYNTGKDPSVSYPVAYTWYDELIVSTQHIADPK